MWTMRSDLDSQSSQNRVKPGIRSRSEALVSSLTIRLARWCKRWHPLAPRRRYRARRSPLSEYMSLHLSFKLTTNCVPFSRMKWDRYIFIKKCVSFRYLNFVNHVWLSRWWIHKRLYNIMTIDDISEQMGISVSTAHKIMQMTLAF